MYNAYKVAKTSMLFAQHAELSRNRVMQPMYVAAGDGGVRKAIHRSLVLAYLRTCSHATLLSYMQKPSRRP